MPSRLRATVLLLLALTLLGAGPIRGPAHGGTVVASPPWEAGKALWNPYDPVGEVVPPTTEPNQRMRAVEEYRGYVYLLGKSGTLYTYDTRDLPGLTTFATYAVPISSVNVGVYSMLLRNGTWLYACGDGGLAVIDLGNPARPLLRVLPDGPGGDNMFQSGERLFVGEKGVATIYSLADPSHPVAIGTYNAPDKFIFGVAAYNDTLYLAESTSDSGNLLRVLSISDPSHPTSVGSQTLPDWTYHLRVLNGQLIVANQSSVSLFSLANPRQPQLLDTQATGGRVCAIDGGNVVLPGLVYRSTDDHLVEVAHYTTGQGQRDGYPYGSAVGSGFVFLAQTSRALILKSAAAPEAWPYHLYLPVMRKG